MTTNAIELAARTADAYSHDAYGPEEWLKCAEWLLWLGLSEADAEIVLRSKVMRWVGDENSRSEGLTSAMLASYCAKYPRPFRDLDLKSSAGRANA
jgi:hypothetical protein